MNTRTIVFSSSYSREQVFPTDVLEEANRYTEILLPILTNENYNEHHDLLVQADFILATWGMPTLTPELLDLMPNLKAIFYAAGSVKGFVTEESWKRGIMVAGAAEANAIPVAEYAFATIILSLKQFWRHSKITKAKQWEKCPGTAGSYRSKVGIVSLGAIARRVTDLLRATEVEVIAYDPFCTPEAAAACGVRLVSLEEIFEQADVVSLHTPWIPETVGMIHEGLLQRMKPGATLINTARGALIKEDDLARVFAARNDLSAILDVTHPEPPAADSPLLELDNIILTPHIAGSLDGECARMGRWMVEEIRRYNSGQPLLHALTREMLARMA